MVRTLRTNSCYQRFVIISSLSGLFSEQRRVTLTEYEYKKFFFSGDFGFYKKRSLLPISVANGRSKRTEVEKISNFRNLFCMVAISLYLLVYFRNRSLLVIHLGHIEFQLIFQVKTFWKGVKLHPIWTICSIPPPRIACFHWHDGHFNHGLPKNSTKTD